MTDCTMTVVYVEPGKMARITEMGTELKDLQNAVHGHLEACYPFEDPVCLVCNDEGKINGMRLNRAIYDENGKTMDIIAGPFFVCGLGEEDFIGLTDEQAAKYMDQFKYPERFRFGNGDISVIQYDPSKQSREVAR